MASDNALTPNPYIPCPAAIMQYYSHPLQTANKQQCENIILRAATNGGLAAHGALLPERTLRYLVAIRADLIASELTTKN